MAPNELQQDWDNREFVSQMHFAMIKLVSFLNRFEAEARYKLAVVNEKLTSLERKADFVEATLKHADPNERKAKRTPIKGTIYDPEWREAEFKRKTERIAKTKMTVTRKKIVAMKAAPSGFRRIMAARSVEEEKDAYQTPKPPPGPGAAPIPGPGASIPTPAAAPMPPAPGAGPGAAPPVPPPAPQSPAGGGPPKPPSPGPPPAPGMGKPPASPAAAKPPPAPAMKPPPKTVHVPPNALMMSIRSAGGVPAPPPAPAGAGPPPAPPPGPGAGGPPPPAPPGAPNAGVPPPRPPPGPGAAPQGEDEGGEGEDEESYSEEPDMPEFDFKGHKDVFVKAQKPANPNGKAPNETSDLIIAYTGWIANNGSYFDKHEEFEVTMGSGDNIAGLEEILMGMKEGQNVLAFIPAHKAYGAEGAGEVIPPDSDLVFDLTLVEVQS